MQLLFCRAQGTYRRLKALRFYFYTLLPACKMVFSTGTAQDGLIDYELFLRGAVSWKSPLLFVLCRLVALSTLLTSDTHSCQPIYFKVIIVPHACQFKLVWAISCCFVVELMKIRTACLEVFYTINFKARKTIGMRHFKLFLRASVEIFWNYSWYPLWNLGPLLKVNFHVLEVLHASKATRWQVEPWVAISQLLRRRNVLVVPVNYSWWDLAAW